MRSQSLPEVIERLARARDDARRERRDACLAFDGDGTLWSGDVGEDLYHAMVEDGGIREEAHAPLRELARAHGVEPGGTASELALRVMEAYERGAFPEDVVYEITAWLNAGWGRAETAAYARAVLDRAPGFDARVHAEAAEVIAWARREGVAVYVVSASPRPIVEEAAARFGIPAADVVALTAPWADETLRAEVLRPIPYAGGKVELLRARAGERVVCGAFGDNAFDAPMLRAARVPVAIRPKARLLAVAAEVPGLVELQALVEPEAGV